MNKKYQSGIDNNKIRELRHKLELRMVDMADVMGFEVIDRLSYWERGRSVPGLINAIKLTKLFNCSLDDIYPGLCQQIEQEILESQNANFIKNLDRYCDPADSHHTS